MIKLCQVCTAEGAPRPSGTQTFTFGGVTHKARECAAISSIGQTPVATDDGYRTSSGLFVCMECFTSSQQHTYSDPDNPHPDDDPKARRDRAADRRRRHDLGGV